MSRSNPDGPAAIVDPYSSGAFFAPAFKEAGVPVVAVVSAPEPPEVYAASYRPDDFPEIITFTGDLEPVVRRLREIEPRCLLAGCESGVELTETLAPMVVEDVANVASLATARRHKGDMAAAVAAAGLPSIAQICTDDVEEVEAWIARMNLEGRDLVLKPTKSASTDGVVRLPGGQSWREAFESQLGEPNRLGIVNDRLLMQEYLTGIEYVVDTFTYGGVHSVADICKYRKVDNGPYMAIYDCMEWLPPDEPGLDEIIEYSKGVLDAVGMRFGTAHIEVMLTADGPRLIEIGARPHGGGHPRFCRAATGDSQVDRAVRYFARSGEISPGFILEKRLLVVFLLMKSAGVVRNAEVFEAVRSLDSYHYSIVNLHNGDRVNPTKDLFGSLDLGFVVLMNTDRAQMMADYDEVRRVEGSLVLDAEQR